MEQLTLAKLRADPELRREIVRAAHRQRNAMIGLMFARLLSAIRGRRWNRASSTGRHAHA